MIFTKIPHDYQGVYSPILYSFEEENARIMNMIEILDGDHQILGEKYFTGAGSNNINVSGYAKRLVSPEPFPGGASGIYNSTGRTAEIIVASDSVMIPKKIFVAGIEPVSPLTIISGQPGIAEIPENGFAELSFVAPGSEVNVKLGIVSREIKKDIEFKTGECDSGMCLFFLNVSEVLAKAGITVLPDYCRITATIRADDVPFGTCEFRVVRAVSDSIDLSWLNSRGGFDSYTFRQVGCDTVVSRKSAFVSSGPSTYGITKTETLKLSSNYEPDATIEWLKGILSSRSVWMRKGEKWVQVSIATDRYAKQTEKPNGLTLEIEQEKTNG